VGGFFSLSLASCVGIRSIVLTTFVPMALYSPTNAMQQALVMRWELQLPSDQI
jgi:hypothetical protein